MAIIISRGSWVLRKGLLSMAALQKAINRLATAAIEASGAISDFAKVVDRYKKLRKLSHEGESQKES